MRNLVAPINALEPIEERVLEFQGLNRKAVVDEGEMADMLNLSSDGYPMLKPRKPRGTYTKAPDAIKPISIISRFERIGMIAEKANGDIAFFYNRSEVDNVTGLTADTKMVAINTKICFFPQKTYLEIVRTGSVVTTGDYGYLEETFDNTEGLAVSITITNEDCKINLGMSTGFAYDDAVNMVGKLAYTDKDGVAHSNVDCNVAFAVQSLDGFSLVCGTETFIELVGEGATNITFNGVIDRKMPDLDHIIEWNNRLWGVSNVENTIYACKLGDPKNWQYYQGTSLDSYYAQQGTDEDWTGCAAYSSHLIFFKQNSLARIYGTSPSSWQIDNMQGYGIEEGSSKSVAIINDIVFYKSTVGIMAYEGGQITPLSDKLGTDIKNVVAGTEGIKYYASVEKADGSHELLVFDASKLVWHREDDVRFRDCCTMDGSLYFISDVDTEDFDEDKVYIINPSETDITESIDDMKWMATFGPFDEYIENRKIYSRILLRFRALGSSSAKVYISMNEGEWELVKEYTDVQTGGEYIPIVPRRCDRYSIKIEGIGNTEIKSLTRNIRRGTGNKL